MFKPYLLTIKRFDTDIPRLIGLDRLVLFLKSNRQLIAYLFIAGIIAYAYDFFSFALKIDSENHAFSYGPQGAWVAQGRWGMYLLSWLLLPDVVMPFIPTFIAVSGCVFGALFFVHSLSKQRGLPDFLAAPIAIACPIVYFALYFTTLGYGVGIAFTVSCLGIYLLTTQSWRNGIFATLCFTLGIGIYQAVLPLLASLFCLQAIGALIDKRVFNFSTLFKHATYFLTALIAANILNYIISNYFLHLLHATFHTEYILGFFNFQMSPQYFIETIKKTIDIAWNYYSGGKDYYLFNLLSLKALFIFCLLASITKILFLPISILLRTVGAILLVLAIIAPFSMHILNNGYMPPRTILGVPFVLAGLVFFTASSSSQLVRIVTAILAICCFYNFSVANNRYSFSNQMVWQADRDLSLLILDDIQIVLNKLPHKQDPYLKLPLEIVGWHEYFESPIIVHREVIGASFYTWGAGDSERITRLFETMGVSGYRSATQEEKVSVIEQAQKMPSWPYEGSVDIINGIIVVKLSQYNPNQLIGMCRPPYQKNESCLKYYPK